MNILPTDIKIELKRRLAGKKLVVVGLALMFVLAIAVVLMTTFFVSVKLENSMTDKSTKTAGNPTEYQNLLKSLKSFNSDLKILAGGNGVSPIIVLTKLIGQKPTGVKINGLDLVLGDNMASTTIKIRGVASGRQPLLDYVGALKAGNNFSKTESPISNLLSEGANQFTLNLSGYRPDKTTTTSE